MIEYAHRISRELLRMNPRKLFIFGDNAERSGLGGQAAAARGEPNALGIVTKWRPTMTPGSFLSDDDANAWRVVFVDLARVHHALALGRTIVVPSAGVGTGLSRMREHCPRILAAIQATLFPAQPQDRGRETG